MQLHQLKPNSKARKKRVGRGGAHGTTATRGTKGARARSGGGKGPSFEGNKMPLFRRTPKLRGFKSLYEKKAIVKLTDINDSFSDGEVVSPKTLLNKGIVKKTKSGVKVLGNGDISKKVIIEDCFVSKIAEDKIKKAGGEIRSIVS